MSGISMKCPACNEEYNETTVRPHIIAECGHSMCLNCCKNAGRCPTDNLTYDKKQDFKIHTELETTLRENRLLSRIRSNELTLPTAMLEDLNIDPTKEKKQRLYVRLLNEKVVPIDILFSHTISVLKQEIKRCFNVHVVTRLLYQNVELKDIKRTIASYGIKHGDTVMATARAIGGNTGKRSRN